MLRMLENFGWVGVGHLVDSPGEISPPAAVSAFPLSAILRFPNTKKIRTQKNTRMRDPQLESSEEARLANRSLDSDLRFCRTPGDLRFQLITDSLQMCSLMNSTKTNKMIPSVRENPWKIKHKKLMWAKEHGFWVGRGA